MPCEVVGNTYKMVKVGLIFRSRISIFLTQRIDRHTTRESLINPQAAVMMVINGLGRH